MYEGLKGRRLAKFVYPVERCKIKEMAEAIGDTNSLYTDPEIAKAEGYRDVIAPPTFGTCANLWGGPGFRKLMKKLGANPMKVLHAEQEYEYFAPIHPGDTLHVTIDVADLFSKEGRTGKMQFVTLQTTSCNQDGKKVLIGRSTILERP